MEGKVALVTGGMGGIGTVIAQKLAEQGAQVSVAYHREPSQAKIWQEEQKNIGYDFHIVQADITNFDSSLSMVNEVIAKFNKIDLLINNAGIVDDATLAKMSIDQWHKVINADLNSLFNVTKNVLPSMIKTGYGRIINISSVNAQKGQFGQTNYSAAKAGVHGFTKSLAQELARKGITVNTVSPGYVKTKMMDQISKDILLKIIEQIPAGRLALPVEVAHLVAFLASEQAAYITGANFAINGGLHMC
jgi:acetoacetyl-CoA reductase